ncbi:MAG: hypothetical protein ISS69_13445 [Phycisphaerae bacterium]|nr:hypothetical protein [Phycisphaerae bacterium]
MRAWQWRDYLEQAWRRDRKAVFTLTELANIAGVAPRSLNVQLGRLVRQGMITRFASGRYGLAGRVAPEELVGFLDSGAYITGLHALAGYNLVTQQPTSITCFTNRRHNRSRIRKTPIGTFSFVCVSRRIYNPPAGGNTARPEQAFCDWIYLCLRKGLSPESMVTLSDLSRLSEELLADLLPRYPKTVTKEIDRCFRRG